MVPYAVDRKALIALGVTIGCLATGCTEEGAALENVEPERASFAHDLGLASGENGGSAPIGAWPHAVISYAFDGFHYELDETLFRFEVRAALDEWTRATQGRRVFYEVEDAETAQLVIGFRDASHTGKCLDFFTHDLRTIAHVFTYEDACLAGVLHFNGDLTWVMDGSNRNGTYDVRYATLHEVGHILGLDHVGTAGHIMYPEYIGVVRRLTDGESEDVIRVLEGVEND